MKKKLSMVAAAVLLLTMLLPMTVSAASASAKLEGPGTVRAGDTITLTFNLTGTGLEGASGALDFDSSQVSLTGTKQKISNPWAVEFNGNNFVAYDNNLSAPIKGTKALFTATFKVKNVDAGTAITISCKNVTASDGSADANVGTVSYSVKVAPPLATNNELGSLTVSNAEISPAFNAKTTAYTAKVPFSVSKLDIKAAAADGKATVSINNPTLKPDGTTNVTVTVKAENGAKKTYSIKVFREKDPNYQASTNNTVSDIKVDGFLLSPGFSKDVFKYVVWLPYEVDSIKVSAKAEDGKASIEIEGGDQLLAGQDNEVKVICIAESGDKQLYTVVAKRAPAHDGSVDEKPEPEPTEPEATEPTAPTEPPADKADGDTSGLVAWWWLLIVAFYAILGGAAAGYFIAKRKYQYQ